MTDIIVATTETTVEVVSPVEATVDVTAATDTIVVDPPDFAYISVYDTTDQADGDPLQTYKITCNTVEEQYLINFSNGVFTFLQSGLYSITFSVQWQNTNSQDLNAAVFLKKNNQVLANSNSYESVPSKHGAVNGAALTTVNFVQRYAANDTLSLWWHSEGTGCSLKYVPATVTPEMPVSPSVVITIVQVS